VTDPRRDAETDAGRDPLERLADSFLARYRAGERPRIEEYAARYPELSDELRDLLPALVELERGMAPEGESTLVPDRGVRSPHAAPPRQLGDYLLLREVGRGGMGVVYEAVQRSLGRHVALKLLPAGGLADPTRLERFRLEARAAARLHHGNIVPVFGVGEQGGVHYYAMQYIRGQTLDAVIDELRRLRGGLPRAAAAERSDTPGTANPLARTAAFSLLSDRFEFPAADDDGSGGPTSSPSGPRATSPSAADESVGGGGSRGPELSGTSGGYAYYRSVGRVGLQAAEALAYAHGQGVLHRDVKPSNLMLDAAGTVWVADFGLAKAGESDGLTQTGDIVGTLRYMAPERFDGRGDARSDVYGLGATLYELLTLRPMFDEPDRVRLIDRVLRDAPPLPRKADPHIPRDLETVVLKATARDPSARYGSAAEMAEDLRRFLSDRPVLARRASAAERLARWSRRNPAVATLSAAVAVLLLALSAWSAYYAAQQERIAGERKDEARRTAESLHRSLLGQATAVRLARIPGFRSRSWAYLREAAALDVPRRDPADRRREVLAGLGDPVGLEPVREPRVEPVATVPVPSGVAASLPDVLSSAADAGGRFVAAAEYAGPDAGEWAVVLRDAEGRELARRTSPLSNPHFLEFTPDGTKLAAGCEQGVAVWSTPDLTPWAAFRGDAVHSIALHPSGRLLASKNLNDVVEVWDTESNRLAATFAAPAGTSELRFSKDGTLLLALSGATIVSADGETHRPEILVGWPIRDTPERRALFGHRGGVPGVVFGPDGRLLASVSKDGTIRLWEARTGGPVAAWPEDDELQSAAFSPDGRFLATSGWKGHVRVREVATGEIRAEAEAGDQIWHLRFGPGGESLVACGERLWFWRFRSAPGAERLETALAVDVPNSPGFALHPSGTSCSLLARDGVVHRFDLGRGAVETTALRARPGVQGLEYDPAGRLLFVAWGRGFGWADPVGDAFRETVVSVPADVAAVRLSPDGCWAATQVGPGRIAIYDPAAGREAYTLPAEASPAWYWSWSPDGTRLAVGLADGGVALWDLEQVRTRLAEFDVSVPSTAGRTLGPPRSPAASIGLLDDRLRLAARRADLLVRAPAAGRAARWRESAAAYNELIEIEPEDHWHWFRGAAAFAAAGDREGYRRHCRRMLDRFGDTEDPQIAERTAKSCALLPDDTLIEEAYRLAVRSSETAEPGLLPYSLAALALAEVRAGRAAEAVGSADRSLELNAGWISALPAHYARSMALARLGRGAEARAAFEAAAAIARRFQVYPPLADLGDGWHDVAICNLLRQQAAATAPAEAETPAGLATRAAVDSHRTRGDQAGRERRWADGVPELTALRDLTPGDFRSHWMLCHALQGLGDAAAHREAAERMIDRFAGTREINAASFTVHATATAEVNAEHAERRLGLAELIPADTDRGRRARAIALLDLGRWEEAAGVIEGGLVKDAGGTWPLVYLWRARALHHLGDRAAAREAVAAAGREYGGTTDGIAWWGEAGQVLANLRALGRLDPSYPGLFERPIEPAEAPRPPATTGR